MEPLTIAAGAMVVGALVQAWNGAKARGAQRDELNKIEQAYNSVKPPDYDLSIMDPPQLHTQALQSPKFSDPVQAPRFDMSRLTPEAYKIVGKYAPEAANFIKEAAPQTVEKTADMKTGRDAQMNALRRFIDIGEGGYDPEFQEATTRASRSAQADAQSRQQSLLQDFARRGQLGSGAQLAAQIGAGSQAMNNQAMANMSAATQAYRNRLDALARGADLGGQIGRQDMDLQKTNADIINDYNQRLTSTRQNWENNRANMMNQAQLVNLQAEQGVADKNVGARNDAMTTNQKRLDDLQKFGYDAALKAQARQDNLAQWDYGRQFDERSFQNQAMMQKYLQQKGERDRIDRLTGQRFQDDLAKAGLKAGVATQRSNLGVQQAQDQNQMIQGLANAGMIYGTGAQAQQQAQQRMAGDKDLAMRNALIGAKTPEEEEKIRRVYS